MKNFDSYLWKYKTMMTMSFAMGIAFMVFMTIFEAHVIGFTFYKLEFGNLFSTPITDLLNLLLLFFLPFILINYFLVFYNNKYEGLIKKYKYNEGRYIAVFFISCMALPLLCFLLLIIFK